VTDLKATAYQFLSRRPLPSGIARFPAKRPGTEMCFECSVINKPFDISFASISGQNPSIGAHQYVNLQDHYADSRWPTCVFAEVTVGTAEGIDEIMRDIREILYIKLSDNPLFQASDHLSQRAGYRRSYANRPVTAQPGLRMGWSESAA
jgi:hypothetical protein